MNNSSQQPFNWRWFVLISMLMMLSACVEVSVPEGLDPGGLLPNIELPSLLASPTPQPAPTPVGDTLTFTIPAPNFNIGTLAPSQTVPGTRLEFVTKQGDIFYVRIDGFDAQKRSADSFPWRGMVAPGVMGNYDLYLLPTYREDQLAANGSVALTILNPFPIQQPSLDRADESLLFSRMSIDHVVPQGRSIPGTTLVFSSYRDNQIEFTGTTGFPTYQFGDTLRWSGTLRDNVFVIYDLEVIGIETHGLRVRGFADVRVYTAAVP